MARINLVASTLMTSLPSTNQNLVTNSPHFRSKFYPLYVCCFRRLSCTTIHLDSFWNCATPQFLGSRPRSVAPLDWRPFCTLSLRPRVFGPLAAIVIHTFSTTILPTTRWRLFVDWPLHFRPSRHFPLFLSAFATGCLTFSKFQQNDKPVPTLTF